MKRLDHKSEVTYAARQCVTSLYIHVPFCHGTCAYCDFFSVPDATKELVDSWYEGVFLELARISEESQRHRVEIRPLETVYFGGGTPSYLKPEIMADIIGRARALFHFSSHCDITLEANPESIVNECSSKYESIQTEIPRLWREAGINRVSFGLQSATDSLLKLAGRRHTVDQATQAVELADDAGIRDISIDLMTGLPTQSLDDIDKALELVRRLPINHVSSYALSLSKGTPFYDRWREAPDDFPDDDLERLMNTRLIEGLHSKGLRHYEISNFACSGAESKHNLVYWHADPYLAVGPAAASYMGGVRRCNPASFDQWLSNVRDHRNGPFGEATVEEIVDEQSARIETMILGLRLMEGVSHERFYQRHQVDYNDIFAKQLARLERERLIERLEDRICLSSKGLDFADVVAREFL